MIDNLALNIDLRQAMLDFPNGKLLFSHAGVVCVTPSNVTIYVTFHSEANSINLDVPFEPDGSADFFTAFARALIIANIGG